MTRDHKILQLPKPASPAQSPGPDGKLTPHSPHEIHVNLKPPTGENQRPTASRHDLHLPRRVFHAAMGVAAGTVYGAFVTHTQAAYILGFAVSILYLLDQIRVKYPEIAERITGFNSLLVRAEERLKESSSVPYAIACTLCVLSFPKPVALIAIFTVALADPIAAIVGISHGKRVLVGRKTLEGSLAFFTTTLVISFSILLYYTQSWKVLIAAPMISFLVSMLELIPMRLDDNLLIPLYASFVSLAVASAFGLGL